MSAGAFLITIVLALSTLEVRCFSTSDILSPLIIKSSSVEGTPDYPYSYLTTGEHFTVKTIACIENGVPAHLLVYLPVLGYHATDDDDPYSLLVTVNDAYFTFVDSSDGK